MPALDSRGARRRLPAADARPPSGRRALPVRPASAPGRRAGTAVSGRVSGPLPATERAP